jgi:predicted ATPase
MHRELSIENFKCFSEPTKIELGMINVCLGCNSVGKSSVIQSLILVRQMYEKAKLYKDTVVKEFSVQLNDVYGLQLGDSEHIKSSRNKEDIILGIDKQEYKLISIPNNQMEMRVEFPCSPDSLSKEGLYDDVFYYLNAERFGPRNYQLIDSKLVNTCGVCGENTVHLLNSVGNSKVEDDRCFPNEEKKVTTLSKQVEYWMDYVIPGIELNTDDLTELRVSRLQLQQTTLDTGFLSPYNFGFGISYVLPVIVTGLMAKKGSVFLVENPEAHLHPMGQSHIGYFLAMMAFSGVQIVVETHSEHVLNGIRIAALKNKISPDEISINYFSIKKEDGGSKHNVERIRLSERMDLECWPDGFMDQEEEDLRILRELRRN